jgi:SNF2 family DNA or RNA helicase
MDISVLKRLAQFIQIKTWDNQCISILWISVLSKLIKLNKDMIRYINHIRYQGSDLQIDYEWARVKYNDVDTTSEKQLRLKSLRYIPKAIGYFDHLRGGAYSYQTLKTRQGWETKRLNSMPTVAVKDRGVVIRDGGPIEIKHGLPYIELDINKTQLSKRFVNDNNGDPLVTQSIDSHMWKLIFQVAKNEMSRRVNLSQLLAEESVNYNIESTYELNSNLCTNLTLGVYQLENIKWMQEIEKNVPSIMQYTKGYRFGKYYIDPYRKKWFHKKPENSKVNILGGALLDEMGLGKTIVMLLSALSNPADDSVGTPDRYVHPQMKTKCTALISSKTSKLFGLACDAVVKEEFQSYCKKHRKSNSEEDEEFKQGPPPTDTKVDDTYYYKTSDNINLLKSRATLIICPNTVPGHWAGQCLKHIKRTKGSIKILKITCAKEYTTLTYRDVINADFVITSFDFIAKNPLFVQTISVDSPNILYSHSPFLGNIFWHRIIVDEIHEVMDDKYKASRLPKFIMHTQSRARYRWCLSGSAFTRDHTAYRTVVDYLIKGTTHDIFPYLERYHHKDFIQKYFRRNTFQSTSAEKVTELPPVIYKEIWLKFSSTERAMYNTRLLTKRGNTFDDSYLRQLCCHPQLSTETKEVLQGCGSLDQIHDSMKQQTKDFIANIKVEIEEVKEKMDFLSQYLDDKQKNILPEYIQDEDCPDYLTLMRTTKSNLTKKTNQLHNLEKALAYYANPENGTDTTTNVLENLREVDSDDMQYLIHMYGTKMGHLIHYFKNDFQENPTDCAIIFSQWDTLLNNIQITLKQNGISSICCKGNVFQKNKAIEKFQEHTKGIRILLLSTKYAASGLDLMEANKIILFDPVYGTEKYKHGIEAQAIGRAARLGQKRILEVIRFLIKDTIEEEIHYSMVEKDQIQKIKVI